jgi:hypothetical protein
MSKMIQLVEEMRARLNQIADTEQQLVRALSEALSRVDQKLLQDVRDIANEHEARRGAILYELQGLASRIGAFPPAREAVPGLEYAEPAQAHAHAHTPRPIAAANGNQRPPFQRGDWRQATNNIEDELDIYFQDRVVSQ